MTTAMMDFASSMAKFDTPEPEELFLDMGFPPLNKILGGDYTKGFPYGRVAEIYGPAASGKTVLATQAMIRAQQQGGMAIFVDWECAFSEAFAEEMGLNVQFPYFHKITPETFEDGIDMAFEFANQIRQKKPIEADAPIVMVFDSIAAAVPRSVMYDSKGVLRIASSRNMNDNLALAKATSSHMPRIAQMARKFNAVVIFLNQLREKPGVVYGDPTYTPGGKAPEFFSTTRLQVSSKKIMEDAAGGKEFKGRLMEFQTKKSKFTRPFQSIDLRLVYDERGKASFDFTTGMIEHLVEVGKLEEKTGRVTWDGKTYFKSVLKKKLEDEGLVPELYKLIA